MNLPTFETYYPYKNKNHGTNALKFYLPHITVWFSYSTVVAFWTADTGRVISENVWTVTTGKHLNHIDPDHSIRLPHDEFVDALARALATG